jgi:hypothetical protein
MIAESNRPAVRVPENEEDLKMLLCRSFEQLAKTSPSNEELNLAHDQIAVTMKQQGFVGALVELVLERQGDPSQTTFLTQIATTFTTYLRHQQARSDLVLKRDPHGLNKDLVQIFTNPAINLATREALMKHYPQYIFAPGSMLAYR